MGIYLNPDSDLFRRSLNSEMYVDKSMLIHFTNRMLNTEENLVCVSRPRRFGKSMALQMLAAYYSKGCDSRELFEGLKVSRGTGGGKEQTELQLYEKNRNHYDTLLIDMQGVLGDVLEETVTQAELQRYYRELPNRNPMEKKLLAHPLLSAMQRRLIRDLRTEPEFASLIPENESGLGNAVLAVYQGTGRRFILLIDEWDCIFRNYEEDRLLQDKYIDLLRAWFKNTALLPAYALVYMTGILPIKRCGTQSALNNFKEYTMLDMTPLEEFTGFTEEEALHLYRRYGMDEEKAREWYDGYQLGGFGHIYNPNSVVESIRRRKFSNYWTATGTYESVKQPLGMKFDSLREKVIAMLGGGACRIDPGMFNNTMTHFESADDVLTLLIHLGYLGYNAASQEVYIPNKEIRDEFVRAIRGGKWSLTFEAISRSRELLDATLEGDEDTVAARIEKVHRDNTAILNYNDENALSCVITLAYYQARDEYLLVREMPTGKGFADLVFLPRRGCEKPAMVVELKWKKDVKTAIGQIYDRCYGELLQEYFGEVVLVGISYEKDSRDKKHSCKIERIRKE